jgi:hypothetical protein
MPPSADPFSPLVSWLINNGAIGVLALALLYALRVIWNDRNELQKRFDTMQEARLAERDELVKTLADNTRVMQDTMDLISPRRR